MAMEATTTTLKTSLRMDLWLAQRPEVATVASPMAVAGHRANACPPVTILRTHPVMETRVTFQKIWGSERCASWLGKKKKTDLMAIIRKILRTTAKTYIRMTATVMEASLLSMVVASRVQPRPSLGSAKATTAVKATRRANGATIRLSRYAPTLASAKRRAPFARASKKPFESIATRALAPRRATTLEVPVDAQMVTSVLRLVAAEVVEPVPVPEEVSQSIAVRGRAVASE